MPKAAVWTKAQSLVLFTEQKLVKMQLSAVSLGVAFESTRLLFEGYTA